MSFALQPGNPFAVKVLLDWSDADNAASDVATALETSFPGVFIMPPADSIVVTMLNPLSTGSDKGVLTIGASTGSGAFGTAFSSTPEVGSFVFIICMY